MKIQPEDLVDDIQPEELASAIEVRDFVLQQDLAGQRLDKALASLMPEHSRGRIQGWIEAGHVKVNDIIQTKVRQVVAAGDEVSVQVQPSDQTLAFQPDDIEFAVIAQTDSWLVVDKQAGLVVHPGAGNWRQTLLNGLLYRYPESAHIARAGIVHRLDKDTTGLMVVAKTETAQTQLVRQLQDRSVKREYCALVHGWLPAALTTVDRPIGRDPRVPVRMSVSPAGVAKPAITHVERLRTGTLDGLPVSELRCRLETGRTHQIRVHLASLKHPLIGDTLYGGRCVGGASRQMLHARHLSFIDPELQQWVAFDSEMPGDMQAVLAQVSWNPEDR